MRFVSWLLARFRGNGFLGVVVGVALLLALPSIASPLFIDEQVQALHWRAGSLRHFLTTCFVFATPAGNPFAMEHTTGAWWTAPDFQVAFFRPLAALTHALDWALWPASPLLMHLHSLLWLAVLLVLLGALYRQFAAPSVAGLALALYAWDDARGMVLSWIANRHALIAGAFGVAALLAHDRWRRGGWRAGAWLGPFLFALGLLSGELASATLGFLAGHALFVDQGRVGGRLARLSPYGAIAALWQVQYSLHGYGAVATGGYVHPLREPVVYLRQLVVAGPIFALGQLTPLPADLWSMSSTTARVVLYVLAIAVLVGTARLVAPRLRDPAARMWLVGAAGSLMLACTTGPQDRNLVFVGIGVAPVLASALAEIVEHGAKTAGLRRFAAALAFSQLVLGPLLLPAKSLTIVAAEALVVPIDRTIPSEPSVVDQTLVVPSMAFAPAVYAVWARRQVSGTPMPGRTRVLAAGPGAVKVTRTDDRTLRVQPSSGFLADEASRMFRAASRPMHAGETVVLSNMRATVIELTDDGRPATVEFRFSTPLEAPEWVFMTSAPRGLVPWTPPRLGETVVVSGP